MRAGGGDRYDAESGRVPDRHHQMPTVSPVRNYQVLSTF